MLYLPQEVTPVLEKFSERIACGVPTLLPCEPDYQGRFWSCHTNVSERVAHQAGKQVYGYYFIRQFFQYQAVFHSVWETPDGNWIDITPFPDLRNQNLFAALEDQELERYHHPVYFSSIFGLTE